jgi:hypothetical protein
MLSVGIAQNPVPGFRLTEEEVGRVRDSTSQASGEAFLARCLKGKARPRNRASVGKALNGQKNQTNF